MSWSVRKALRAAPSQQWLKVRTNAENKYLSHTMPKGKVFTASTNKRWMFPLSGSRLYKYELFKSPSSHAQLPVQQMKGRIQLQPVCTLSSCHTSNCWTSDTEIPSHMWTCLWKHTQQHCKSSKIYQDVNRNVTLKERWKYKKQFQQPIHFSSKGSSY